jgi:hypothetical protein
MPLREINDNRQEQGKELIPHSTFYRFVNSQKESLTRDAPRELQWLILIRNHLSRIKADESLSDQALLIFEAQVDFIVRLKDILIDELIHRIGWIQQSKDGNRQKIENRIRTNNFSEAEITHHHTTAQVLLDLCRGERKWEFLTEEEMKNLTKNRLIQDLRH